MIADHTSDPAGATERFEKLSIFYPMWNEEMYIERALDAGHRAGRRLLARGDIGDYELIVVDDASTDRTGAIADELAATDPRVRVVHHAQNRKLGGAIKTGFATATGDLILYTDADLPFDMAELPRAVRLLSDYDVDLVSAYRFDRTGEGYLRLAYTFVYNLLIRTMFGVKATSTSPSSSVGRACSTTSSCAAKGRSSTPNSSSARRGSDSRCCSSGSTTSHGRGASPHSARRA